MKTNNSQKQKIVSKENWLAARKAHLSNEKEFTRMRDRLSRERRELPWMKVEKEYAFHGPDGVLELQDLFEGKSQLIVYHFMFGPDWKEGCPICSLWADNFDGINIHLNHRDINLVAVSRAPYNKPQAYKDRMGWSFRWFSSLGSDFNFDYHVSFEEDDIKGGKKYYNFGLSNFPGVETPGISVFYKDEEGEIFHTYSCYSRGLVMLNGAYHFMDLTPKGRDEDHLKFNMQWLRRHDKYGN